MTTTPQSDTDQMSHEMVGRAELRRVGRWRFPVHQLTQDDQVLASVGRTGWFKVFFGRGQRIELADGSRWRIKSLGTGGSISPAIFDSSKRKVAISSVGVGGYGINGMDYGCVFYQADKKRFARANRWMIRHHEDELAVITRNPRTVEASHPVHLGAVLLAFALIRYGILGEKAPRLNLVWQ